MSPLAAPVTSVALLLKLAGSYSWVREHGQNKGEAVAHFLETVNIHDAEPWCAAFVSTVGIDAFGAEWPLPRLAYCPTIATIAAKKGLLFAYPAPGAVFLLWSEKLGRFHHTGFVGFPAVGQAFSTIEGNTNEGGSPDGIGVFQRTRIFKPTDRFVWWWAPPTG